MQPSVEKYKISKLVNNYITVKTFKRRITVHKTSRPNTFWLCNNELNLDQIQFLACDSMLNTLYDKSVRLSVHPSHGWISQKRLNLGSYSFHHTVAPTLSCLRYKSARNSDGDRGHQTRVGWGNELILSVF